MVYNSLLSEQKKAVCTAQVQLLSGGKSLTKFKVWFSGYAYVIWSCKPSQGI